MFICHNRQLTNSIIYALLEHDVLCSYHVAVRTHFVLGIVDDTTVPEVSTLIRRHPSPCFATLAQTSELKSVSLEQIDGNSLFEWYTSQNIT